MSDDDSPFTFLLNMNQKLLIQHFTKIRRGVEESLHPEDSDVVPPEPILDYTHDKLEASADSKKMKSRIKTVKTTTKLSKEQRRPIYTREREAITKLGKQRMQGDSSSTLIDCSKSRNVKVKHRKRKESARKSSTSKRYRSIASVDSTSTLLYWLQESVLPALTRLISLEIDAEATRKENQYDSRTFAAINEFSRLLVNIPIGISGTNAAVDNTLGAVVLSAQKRDLKGLQDAAAALAEFCIVAVVALETS